MVERFGTGAVPLGFGEKEIERASPCPHPCTALALGTSLSRKNRSRSLLIFLTDHGHFGLCPDPDIQPRWQDCFFRRLIYKEALRGCRRFHAQPSAVTCDCSSLRPFRIGRGWRPDTLAHDRLRYPKNSHVPIPNVRRVTDVDLFAPSHGVINLTPTGLLRITISGPQLHLRSLTDK